ncbi:FitA-like ribbon-helix-helix domain-containing protein [Novosphingobium sp.]|uniref:FitA-like ribbon-helix-helix domain-containing protein n=1 Tax=Novosphingobium sp. TaxID=1874826 RepID=UPI003BAB8E43
MATLTVRGIDDGDLAALAEAARQNNRSLSAEVRVMIAERTRKQSREQATADFLSFTKQNPLRLPGGITSLDILRAERDSW